MRTEVWDRKRKGYFIQAENPDGSLVTDEHGAPILTDEVASVPAPGRRYDEEGNSVPMTEAEIAAAERLKKAETRLETAETPAQKELAKEAITKAETALEKATDKAEVKTHE
jgi:mannose/fructose/N-acetylgalactosamine-specific phosphotransferase system component IIB